MAKECDHKAGYRMRDGALVCDNCGQPSPSKHWRDNVFGVKAEGKGVK